MNLTITHFPIPPSDNTDWPWTEAYTEQLTHMPDGKPWPKISIVTPSFNQAQFLEETIRSVLLQHYPNLEYIVIDGGSTDGSVEIIKRYESWLAYWVSEPDRGQSHAINKGFERATGEIIAWLNSDDIYMPGALAKAGHEFSQNPDTMMVYGDCYLLSDEQIVLQKGEPFDIENYLGKWYICQPASFQRRSVLKKIGYLNEKLFYVMDQDWWLRLFVTDNPLYCPYPFARFRSWAGSKTYSPPTDRFFSELIEVVDAFFNNLGLYDNRLIIRENTHAKLLLQESEDSIDRHEYHLTGHLISKAGEFNRQLVSKWHSRITDAIIYSLARSNEFTYQAAQNILIQIMNDWDEHTGYALKQKRLRELKWKLGIMRKGILKEKIPTTRIFMSILCLIFEDIKWLWRQRGWVYKAVFERHG